MTSVAFDVQTLFFTKTYSHGYISFFPRYLDKGPSMKYVSLLLLMISVKTQAYIPETFVIDRKTNCSSLKQITVKQNEDVLLKLNPDTISGLGSYSCTIYIFTYQPMEELSLQAYFTSFTNTYPVPKRCPNGAVTIFDEDKNTILRPFCGNTLPSNQPFSLGWGGKITVNSNQPKENDHMSFELLISSTVEKNKCPANFFDCNNKTKHTCVHKDLVRNGYNDCYNGRDEIRDRGIPWIGVFIGTAAGLVFGILLGLVFKTKCVSTYRRCFSRSDYTQFSETSINSHSREQTPVPTTTDQPKIRPRAQSGFGEQSGNVSLDDEHSQVIPKQPYHSNALKQPYSKVC